MDLLLLLDLECDRLLDRLRDRLCLEDEGVLLLLERDLDRECLLFSSFLSGFLKMGGEKRSYIKKCLTSGIRVRFRNQSPALQVSRSTCN